MQRHFDAGCYVQVPQERSSRAKSYILRDLVLGIKNPRKVKVDTHRMAIYGGVFLIEFLLEHAAHFVTVLYWQSRQSVLDRS